MNKKFLSAILFGALIATSTSTFVSCKDYDDDIDYLQEQIDANKEANMASLTEKVAAIQTQIDAINSAKDQLASALEAAKAEAAAASENALATAKAAQEAANGAQSSADAAQIAADNAMAAAQEALAKVAVLETKAEAAEAAIIELKNANVDLTAKLAELAQANADNKNYTDEQIEALRATLTAEITKVSSELGAKIDAIMPEVNKLLENYATVSDVEAKYAELKSLAESLELQIQSNKTWLEELNDLYATIADVADVKELAEKNKQDIENLEKNKADLAELQALAATVEGLSETLTTAVTNIESLQEELGNLSSKLEDYAAASTVTEIQTKIGKIQEDIESLQTSIANKADKAEVTAEITAAINNVTIELTEKIDEVKAAAEKNAGDITLINNKLTGINDEITALWAAISGETVELSTLISTSIAEACEEGGKITETIKASLADYYTTSEIDGKLKDFTTDIEAINTKLGNVNIAISVLNEMFSTRLTSIVYIPQYFTDGVEAIKFSSLYFKELKKDADETSANPYVSNTTYIAGSNTENVRFRLNPASVSMANIESLAFVDGGVATTRSVANDAPIEIAKNNGINGGVLSLDVKQVKDITDDLGKLNLVTLCAEIKDSVSNGDQYVYSNYIGVNAEKLQVYDYSIATKSAKTQYGNYRYAYAKTFDNAKVTTVEMEAKFAWNKELDLASLVSLAKNVNLQDTVAIVKYGMHWEFSIPAKDYIIDENGVPTPQQEFIKFKEGSNHIVEARVYDKPASESAIGRTPIIQANLYYGTQLVRRAYIKLEITRKPPVDEVKYAPAIDLDGTYLIGCSNAGITGNIGVSKMNTDVYTLVNMSATQFWNNYTTTFIEPKTGPVNNIGKLDITDINGNPGASSDIKWTVTQGEMLAKYTYAQLSAGVTLEMRAWLAPNDPEEYPYIEVRFTKYVKIQGKDDFILNYAEVFWNTGFTEAIANPTTINSGYTPVEYRTRLLTDLFTKVEWPSAWKDCHNDNDIEFRFKNGTTYAGANIATDNLLTLANTPQGKELIGKSVTIEMIANAAYVSSSIVLKEFKVFFPNPLTLTNVATEQSFIDGPSSSIDVSKVGTIKSYWNEEVKKGDVINASLWAHYGLIGNSLTFDLNSLSTSLSNGKMPEGARVELNASGTELTYINTGVKLQKAYTINIPVSIEHKWGILSETLTITVEP